MQSAKLLKASGLANPYMLAKNFTEVRTCLVIAQELLLELHNCHITRNPVLLMLCSFSERMRILHMRPAMQMCEG